MNNNEHATPPAGEAGGQEDSLPLFQEGGHEQSAEKLFYSIGEVSTMTGVEPYVLRYWESEFKLLHPSKRSSGQRSYQKKDIETILTIKHLLYDDLYTIAGAKKKLREGKTQAHAHAAEKVLGAPTTLIEIKRKDEGSSAALLKEIKEELSALQEEIRNA